MENTYQLKEIQLLFNVDQHVLIHLCEKGVIIPEVEDVSGRGKLRRFSKANIFEFAVALELRKYQIPVAVTGAIVRILSSFQKRVKKEVKDFEFPGSLGDIGTKLYLFTGEKLVFQFNKKLFSIDISKLLKSDRAQVRLEELKKLPKDYQSHLEVNLSELAKKYK